MNLVGIIGIMPIQRNMFWLASTKVTTQETINELQNFNALKAFGSYVMFLKEYWPNSRGIIDEINKELGSTDFITLTNLLVHVLIHLRDDITAGNYLTVTEALCKATNPQFTPAMVGMDREGVHWKLDKTEKKGPPSPLLSYDISGNRDGTSKLKVTFKDTSYSFIYNEGDNSHIFEES